MKKTLIISIAVSLVVILLALTGIFVVVPAVQTIKYRKLIETVEKLNMEKLSVSTKAQLEEIANIDSFSKLLKDRAYNIKDAKNIIESSGFGEEKFFRSVAYYFWASQIALLEYATKRDVSYFTKEFLSNAYENTKREVEEQIRMKKEEIISNATTSKKTSEDKKLKEKLEALDNFEAEILRNLELRIYLLDRLRELSKEIPKSILRTARKNIDLDERLLKAMINYPQEEQPQ